MIAYAGLPLTDADGLVLGSLCGIDHRPRAWGPSVVPSSARQCAGNASSASSKATFARSGPAAAG